MLLCPYTVSMTSIPSSHELSAPAGLSIAGLLEHDEIRDGGPEVITGEDSLHRNIRWVHIADSAQVERFLEGGELVLTTATTFRRSPAAMSQFLDQLERAGAAGTIVELVDEDSRPDREAAAVLLKAAAGRELPIILLGRRVKFVRITELAHRRLLAQQLSRLEQAQEIHETFTRLSLERAQAQTIVDRTAALLGAPVVLEDVAHRVLAHAGPRSEALTQNWTDLVSGAQRVPGIAEVGRWRQTPVGLRARRWGRLVVPGHAEAVVAFDQIIERAGEALTLTRMADRDEQDLLLQAQSGLIREIADSEVLHESTARARARSLGFTPCDGAKLMPVVVRLDRDAETEPTRIQLQERGLTQEIAAAATRLGLCVLMTSLQSGVFGFVLAPARAARAPRRTGSDELLTDLLAEVADYAASWVVGVGRTSDSLLTAASRLEAASQVAEVASTLDVREREFYRSSDVRLRGLLSLLAEDSRLRTFAEGELGPLLAGEDPGDEELLEFLELFLAHGGNKSAMARAGFLSRPALYARIAKLQDRLGVSLDDAESRTALHVALLWWRMNG
jgi:purine catabolism regulator